MTKDELDDIEESAIKVVQNMGVPQDAWYPEYGRILKDGKITKKGIEMVKNSLKYEKAVVKHFNTKEEFIAMYCKGDEQIYEYMKYLNDTLTLNDINDILYHMNCMDIEE